GSCVPRHIMSVELAPHCWNDTSFADPEYVMDFRSPNAFCALAITVFASCATALPPRKARHIAITAIFLNTGSPYLMSSVNGFYPNSAGKHSRFRLALKIGIITAR